MQDSVLVLHNIRSAHNVGSMFRTADGAGVSRIVLTGYSPGPQDPRGKGRVAFLKVSLGAEDMVPYSREPLLKDAIERLKKDGYTTVAVELGDHAQNIFEYKKTTDKKIAVVLGNEVDGLLPDDLALCDAVLEIPMRGKKESLNVSVACGIALFTLLRGR